MSLTVIWSQAQGLIQDKIGKTSFDTWFSNVRVKEKDSDTLVIEAPDDFFKNWIVEHYHELLKDIIFQTSSKNIHLEFAVNSNILEEGLHSRITQLEQGFKDVVKPQNKLNPRFNFDNYVVGPSNRFAAAACLAVAESPAKAYNPLFLYGQVGLGKTHLIQAISHKIAQIHPHLKHCYLSSEQFTNELIDAIRHRSADQFRKKYRHIDILLIDDIQFIAGKEATQEEFFHTFNQLHDNRKQIILTSDRPPKEISNLEERLCSRFAWGLIADIQPPNFETRAAILRKKVEGESIEIPDEVIQFIAEQIKTNIRELEGALVRVMAYAILEEKHVTLDLTKLILKDMVKETVKMISIEMVQKAVCQYYQIPISDLRAKRRNQSIVLPRQLAMYLARQLTNMSLPDIGNAFGGKDHTTVLHSCKKIEQQLTTNDDIKKTFHHLSTVLKQ